MNYQKARQKMFVSSVNRLSYDFSLIDWVVTFKDDYAKFDFLPII